MSFYGSSSTHGERKGNSENNSANGVSNDNNHCDYDTRNAFDAFGNM